VHYLDRGLVDVPACLVAPEGRVFKELDGREKAQIRAALLDLQNHRCAYCERRTGNNQLYDGHIEHFRDQSGHDQLTMNWNNLFWSCNDERTCGKHKDKCRGMQGPRCRFEPADLIDPAADDPETYLLFVADGSVSPRWDLDDGARRRAKETIRIFQLNESAYLTRARQDALRPYIAMVNTLIALSPELFRNYVASEVQSASEAPFGTAIKHFLTSRAA